MKAKLEQFKINNDLGFLIQSFTGHSTEEVVSFFNGVVSEIVDKTVKIKDINERWYVNREVRSVYPNTYIPFRLQVSFRFDKDTNRCMYYVTVDFSHSKQTVDVEEVLNSLMETKVLGAESNIPKFVEPYRKAPAGLKHLKG